MPVVYAASQATQVAQGFLSKINSVIVFPLLTLLSAVALLFFLYGGMIFILNADKPAERERGRNHMIWGIVGLFIMVSAFTILSIAAGSFGLQKHVDCAVDPNGNGCDELFLIPSKSGGPTGSGPTGTTGGGPTGSTGSGPTGTTGGGPTGSRP